MISYTSAYIGILMLVSAPGVPNIDIKKTCRQSERTLQSTTGAGTIYNSCMSSETEARKQLQSTWAKYPAVDKSSCVHPNNYMPSYVEWLTCLEMRLYAKELRGRGAWGKPPAPTSSIS
jgi:hypothetical protein